MSITEPALPTIEITSQMESVDCETCGGYSRGTVQVKLPDGRLLEAGYDGHFGNGAWDGNLETAYLWALQALGVELRVNGEPIDYPQYQEEGPELGTWREIDLYPATRELINLSLTTRAHPKHPDFQEPMSISWRNAQGGEETLAVQYDQHLEHYWNGEVASLYGRLLRERAIVEESDTEG